jgi:hypothetical protein
LPLPVLAAGVEAVLPTTGVAAVALAMLVMAFGPFAVRCHALRKRRARGLHQ